MFIDSKSSFKIWLTNLKLNLTILQANQNNILVFSVYPVDKQHSNQPSKLKFLLGRHLATNSFGLGRLFNKSSRQLQFFKCHGDQNGPNLEGANSACLTKVCVFLWS